MVYEVVLAEAHRRCLAALATFNLALDRLIVGKSHVGHVVAAAVALKVVEYHRLALSRCALYRLTHLLRLRPYEAYDAAVALAGLCAVGTRSLRCAALRHLVEVLLVLRHMGLGDLQDLLLRWQELLKLRQLLYGLMGLDVDLVVFFRRDARVTTGEEVGDVFEVSRLDGVGVLRLTQVFVGVLDAKRLEQPFYRFVAV